MDTENIKKQLDFYKQMKESEEKYRSLFQTAYDAIFLAEADTGILFDVNPFGEQLIGYNRDEIIGQPYTFLHPQGEVGGYNILKMALEDPRREIFRGNCAKDSFPLSKILP